MRELKYCLRLRFRRLYLDYEARLANPAYTNGDIEMTRKERATFLLPSGEFVLCSEFIRICFHLCHLFRSQGSDFIL